MADFRRQTSLVGENGMAVGMAVKDKRGKSKFSGHAGECQTCRDEKGEAGGPHGFVIHEEPFPFKNECVRVTEKCCFPCLREKFGGKRKPLQAF